MAETTAGRLAHNLVERQETINRELARNGVRFGIYRDGTYHDRLFPYDPVPRLIPRTSSTVWRPASSSA